MSYVPNDLLSRLVGLRLFSVQFVMDYVQLHFDGAATSEMPILTCFSLPEVTRGGHAHSPGDVGWADALRLLIPAIVTKTREETGAGIEIHLGGELIRIHPTAEQVGGPEIAMLSGFGDRHWMVWRPGEESFEDLA